MFKLLINLFMSKWINLWNMCWNELEISDDYFHGVFYFMVQALVMLYQLDNQNLKLRRYGF